jgi:hypothetical protein
MTKDLKSDAVFHLALSHRRYDDANPDVGMGWMDDHYIDRAITQLTYSKNDVNYSELIKRMKKTR